MQYLRQLKDNNHVICAALLALRDIGEPVRGKNPSGPSVIEMDKGVLHFSCRAFSCCGVLARTGVILKR